MLKGLKSGAGLLHKSAAAAQGSTAARNFSFTVNGSQATAGKFCKNTKLSSNC